MQTDECGPKPHILTDRQTGEKGTCTNECIRVCGKKPRRLTYRQTEYMGTCTNLLLRVLMRQKYVLDAQYIMVSS